MTKPSIVVVESFSDQPFILNSLNEIFGHDYQVIGICRKKFWKKFSKYQNTVECPDFESDEFEAFIFKFIKENNVKLIHFCKSGYKFQKYAKAIQDMGCVFVNGGSSKESFENSDQKMLFTKLMQKNDIPVVPAILAENSDRLSSVVLALNNGDLGFAGAYKDICVKPNVGIYGLGFWILSDRTSHKALYFKDNNTVNLFQYLGDMMDLQKKGLYEPLIVMPCYTGLERSIDFVIHEGEVVSAVIRRKDGDRRYFEDNPLVLDMVGKAAKLLGLDGVINAQTIDDSEGTTYLLEFNARPSGGMTTCIQAGVNLEAIMVKTKLGLSTVVPNELKFNYVEPVLTMF